MSVEAPPREAFDLQESGYTLQEGALQEDGSVLVHIIRPGVGRGRGSHYYSPEMLRENAEMFTGMKMFANHLSSAAKKALGGLPRPVEHLSGRILESWWDDSVPADERFEAGAVVGRARPVGVVKALIEDDPSLIETSISTQASGVRKTTKKGQAVWAVEGFAEKSDRPGMAVGSVDFVTEAGAGGKVLAALQEAAADDEQAVTLLDALDDLDIQEYLENNRPELLEAAGQRRGEGGSNSGQSQEDDVEITPEVLTEALQSPEAEAYFRGLLEEAVRPLQDSIDEVREQAVNDASADLQRQIELRDLRDQAHTRIDEAKLPEKFASRAKAEFELQGDIPSDALNVFPDVDNDGNVVKSTEEHLNEAVDSVVDEMRDLVQSINPTTIRGQGGRTRAPGQGGGDGGSGDGDGGGGGEKASRVDDGTRHMLHEAGVSDEEIDGAWTEDNPLVSVIG